MNRMTCRAVAWILAVMLLMLPAAWAEEGFGLQGTYVLLPEQSADIAAAIETAIANMNFIKRPIARSRLKKTNTAYQRIHLARAAADYEITYDNRQPIRMPASGTAVKWTREDGEVFDVSAVRQGQHLVQTYKAEDGTRVNTFRWDEGAQRLYLDVMVTSGQLPQPVKYTLAYRRAE